MIPHPFPVSVILLALVLADGTDESKKLLNIGKTENLRNDNWEMSNGCVGSYGESKFMYVWGTWFSGYNNPVDFVSITENRYAEIAFL